MKNILGLKFLAGIVIAGIIIASGLFYRGFFAVRKTVINMDSSSEQISGNEAGQEKQITPIDAVPISLPEEASAAKSVEKNEDEKIATAVVADKNLTEAVDKTGEKTESANNLISWGFQKTAGRKIDAIIVHSSYDALGGDPYSVKGVIAEYKQYGVSAHYLIDREGKIYQLVTEKNIAWHAGVAKVPDGRTNVNEFSIGIEMLNTKDDKFTSAQYSALNKLVKEIKGRYQIKYVLGHDQVAPGRKDDPWNMDWNKVKK